MYGPEDAEVRIREIIEQEGVGVHRAVDEYKNLSGMQTATTVRWLRELELSLREEYGTTHTCSKRRLSGQAAAKTRAKVLSSTTEHNFRTYICTECRGWHLTSTPRDVAAAIARAKNGSGAQKPRRPLRGRRPKPGQTVYELAEQMRNERSAAKQ